MELQFLPNSAPMDTLHKEAVMETAPHEDKVKDGSTKEEMDPWNPPYPPRAPGPPVADLTFHVKLAKKWMAQRRALLATSRATKIITPDRTPQKIFMDTIRLLAKHTDNLLDQLWNYIKDGKLPQTAILLLAAQEQIRTGTSHKSKVNSKLDGFAIITGRIAHNIALQSEACENIMDPNQLRKININNVTLSLVDLISRAGEALDSYIRVHPKVPYVMQVPHSEVLDRVSLILKEHGFCRTAGRIDIGNLCPYKNVLSNEDLRTLEKMGATKSATEVGYHAAKEEGPIKKIARGWELKYARRSFFPYWRSVLEPQSSAKMSFIKPMLTLDQINHDRGLSKSAGIGSTFGGLMDRVPQPIVNHQPRRLFGTAALTLLKVLKNA